jgi:signal transduction histidine kinase
VSHSIRRRFLVISTGVTLVALVAAGVVLYALFQGYVTTRQNAEIRSYLFQLIGGIDLDSSGEITNSAALAEPRFGQPMSGLYWQVDSRDRTLLRSRSLWDATLETPGQAWMTMETPEEFPGPFDEPVLIEAKVINIGEAPNERQLRVLVGVNADEIHTPLARFALFLAASLAVLGVTFLLVSAVQFRIVMTPIDRLRRNVRDVSDGRANSVIGDYPVEIAPLSNKLNLLLLQQQKQIEKARARAGNFAHSLKTPLTIIDILLTDLRKAGLEPVASEIGSQTAALRQLADRELARTKVAAGHGAAVADMRVSVDELISTIQRLPRGDRIVFKNRIPAKQSVQVDREDFTELVGNLLDNARKWASSSVVVELEGADHDIQLTISDDGPGVADSEIVLITERGRRLDERTQGSGIGLAIVKDIADAYGIPVGFSRSAAGGLKVSLPLPAASGARDDSQLETPAF